LLVWFMVFSATFNNISVILWWSVLLMEETGVPGEDLWPVAKSLTNFITYKREIPLCFQNNLIMLVLYKIQNIAKFGLETICLDKTNCGKLYWGKKLISKLNLWNIQNHRLRTKTVILIWIYRYYEKKV
jgi:hypothetical protein